MAQRADPEQLAQLTDCAMTRHGSRLRDELARLLRRRSASCNPAALVTLSGNDPGFQGIIPRVDALDVLRSTPSMDSEFVHQLEQFPSVPLGSVDLILWDLGRVYLTRVTPSIGSSS